MSQRPASSSASSTTGSFSSPGGGGGSLPSGSGTGGHGLLAVFGHPGLARTLVAMFGEVVRTLWLPCHAGASEQILLSVRPGCVDASVDGSVVICVDAGSGLQVRPGVTFLPPPPCAQAPQVQLILNRAALFALHWTLAALVASPETRQAVQV